MLLVSIGTLSPGAAFAQDDLEQARKKFKEGERLYQKQDFKGAARAFTESYKLSQRDELLYYMGKSWEAEGDLLKARKYYQLYLNNVPDATNAEAVLDVVIELQGRIRKEMGLVMLTTNVTESKVFVDDEVEPRCTETPCTVALKPGREQTIRVVDNQNRETSQSFSVERGKRQEVTLSTEPKITKGLLVISSDLPSAIVRVGSSTHPLDTPIPLESGQHSITLTDGDDHTWRGNVSINTDETTSLMVPMAHLGQRSSGGGINLKRVGAYSLLSVGAGLLVGGALMGRQARTTFNTLDTRRSQGAAIDQGLIDQGRSQKRSANILFITGGLAAAGGGGLFAWDIFGKGGGPTAPPSSDEEAPEPGDDEENDALKIDTLD